MDLHKDRKNIGKNKDKRIDFIFLLLIEPKGNYIFKTIIITMYQVAITWINVMSGSSAIETKESNWECFLITRLHYTQSGVVLFEARPRLFENIYCKL